MIACKIHSGKQYLTVRLQEQVPTDEWNKRRQATGGEFRTDLSRATAERGVKSSIWVVACNSSAANEWVPGRSAAHDDFAVWLHRDPVGEVGSSIEICCDHASPCRKEPYKRAETE